jgi:hypothetical protein
VKSVITFFYDIPYYLAICTDNANYFEEICRRAILMVEIFNAKKLSPISLLPFYLTAAEGYLTIGNIEKALVMLEAYTEVATGDIYPQAIKGDDFFTLIEEFQNKQLNERPFGMPEVPHDEQSIKQKMIDAIINNLAFSVLHEKQQFQDIVKKLKQIL